MRKLPHWLEELTPSDSVDLFRELAISHAWEGGPVGERIAELIKRDDMRRLCEFEIDYESPEWLQDVPSEEDIFQEAQGLTQRLSYAWQCSDLKISRVKACRQALAYFQKLEGLEIGIDKEAVALRKFLEAEVACKETNDVLRKVRRGEFSLSPRVSGVIHAAQRKIARILGDVPSLESLALRFGPGATRGTKKKDASIRRKLAERLQCSEDLLSIVKYLLEEMPHLADIHTTLDWVDEDGQERGHVMLEIIPAKLAFVPKNAKTYRSTCTEPGLNVLVQLGIGDAMDKRLAAFGIDIHNQAINQDRAREGSLTGALATLDLSSASDTVAFETVWELLPLDWAMLLTRARSSNVILPGGKIIRQEKFSSMGNGFTFPLETLIFWSLAAACCPKDSDATVYGDDIVIPSGSVDLLVEVLTTFGFEVNLAKSYSTGPFRESCGKDYYLGTDVRPYYASKWVTGQSLFVLHNFYVRRGDLERAKRVESFIHPALRLYGPDGFGDGHLLGDHPKRRPAKYEARGWSGYFFDTLVTRTSKDKIPLERGEYVVPLYSIYRRSSEKWSFPLDPVGTKSANLETDNSLARAGNVDRMSFWLKYQYGVGPYGPAPLSLPDGDEEGKQLPLPGVTGYKKITVYTLGN